MIPGFFNQFQKDVSTLYHYISNDPSVIQPTQQEVNSAAIRTLAGLGMFFAAIKVGSFLASTVLGALFLGAFAISMYVVCHDIFVISINGDRGGASKGICSDLGDLFAGRKSFDSVVHHPYTKDTFARDAWDMIFA